MNLKLLLFLFCLTLFSIVSLPIIAPLVRIIICTGMMVPSMFALGMTFYYYKSLSSNLQTLLTTSVKSIFVCHMIFNLSSHLSLSSSVIHDIFNNDYIDKQNLQNNETSRNSVLMSEKCLWTIPYSMISFQYPAVMMFTAFAEFQVLRTALEFFPHEFLALNQEILIYPMIFSIPIIACLIMGISLITEGTLCYRRILEAELYYLQNPLSDNFLVAQHDPFDILKVLLLSLETIIQVKRKWNKIKSFTYFGRQNNSVQPISDHEFVAINIETNNPTSPKQNTKLGSVSFVFIISVPIIIVKYNYEFIGQYLDNVLLEMIRWWLPLHWILSKQEITDFIQFKINQFKLNYGYY